MTDNKTDNKRKVERFDLQVPAWVETDNPEEKGKLVKVQVKNISSDGAFITANNLDFSAYGQVSVTILISVKKLTELFGIDDRVLVKVGGKIVRKEEAGAAIRFQGKRMVCSTQQEFLFD
jgi:ribosomal protein S1